VYFERTLVEKANPPYLEGALMFAREDYSGAIEMVKKRNGITNKQT